MKTSVFYSIIRNCNHFIPKGCCLFCPVSCVFSRNMGLFQFYHFAHWVNQLGKPLVKLPCLNVIKQLVHESAVRSSTYEALGKFGEHSRS